MKEIRNNSLIFLFLSTIFTLFAHGGWAGSFGDDSSQVIMGEMPEDTPLDMLRFAAAIEEHTFDELTQNLSKKTIKDNFVFKHPLIAMSAAQRLLTMFNAKAARRIKDPEFGAGEVFVYPAFSDGIKEASGLRINGQYRAIEAFVSHIEGAARGAGSASKMLLFEGPSGTGKSEFIKIIGEIGKNLSLKSPDLFLYTYEWDNLREIKNLNSVLNIDNPNTQHEYVHPMPCPLHESPFQLLPKTYQTRILKFIKKKVQDMANVVPMPPEGLCPQCAHVKNEILMHYMKQNKLAFLKDADVITALTPHLRIKRIVLGDNNTLPKLDAEPRDPDLASLFFSPNPIILMQKGPNHPFSYFLNGKVLKSHGTALLADEFFRNHAGLRDIFLNIIEQHVVRHAGAPEIHLDTVIIGASNNQSIEAVKADGKADAHIDRTRKVPMPLLINPYFVAKNLLSMQIGSQSENLVIKKLGMSSEQEDSQFILMNKSEFAYKPLDELFLIAPDGSSLVGPDHRYKISMRTDARGSLVHVSPHTLMYIAMTAAGSRLETNRKKALDHGEKAVINDAAYRDVYTRLKVLMRQHDIKSANLQDLRSLSARLKEGHFGISERDAANVWLSGAIDFAHRENKCLTPNLARDVFHRLLDEGAIKFPDDITRTRWIAISDQIMTKHTIPALQSDVSMAMGAGLGKVDGIYQEVFAEMIELAIDEDALTYEFNNETRTINSERLEEIKRIYEEQNNRKLPYQEISTFDLKHRRANEKIHKGLLDVVTKYLSSRVTDTISLNEIQNYFDSREGNSETQQKLSAVGTSLEHEFGYCQKCMKTAAQLVNQATSRAKKK